MKVVFAKLAGEDYAFWWHNNRKVTAKIDKLVADIQKHPTSGLGKPERLRGERQYLWSRRMDKKNRLVYMIDGEVLVVVQCRGHYGEK